MKVNMDTKQTPNGTSYQAEIDIAYSELVIIFGQPNRDNDGYKVDAEWGGEIDGEFFTIYNYKTGKNYLGEEGKEVENIREWHIGGYNKKTGKKVIEYIESF